MNWSNVENWCFGDDDTLPFKSWNIIRNGFEMFEKYHHKAEVGVGPCCWSMVVVLFSRMAVLGTAVGHPFDTLKKLELESHILLFDEIALCFANTFLANIKPARTKND